MKRTKEIAPELANLLDDDDEGVRRRPCKCLSSSGHIRGLNPKIIQCCGNGRVISSGIMPTDLIRGTRGTAF